LINITRWWKNGAFLIENNNTLNNASFVFGDNITCESRAFDGFAYGLYKNSTSVWINATLVNGSSTNITNMNLLMYQYFVNGSTYSYQENPNQYDFNEWNIAVVGNWTNRTAIVDGDWNTYSNVTYGMYGLVTKLNVNYTKPVYALNTSLWQVKFWNGTGIYTVNLSINKNCWDTVTDRVSLGIQIWWNPGAIYFVCYNSTNNENNMVSGDIDGGVYAIITGYDINTSFYEEAMIWNLSTAYINITSADYPRINDNLSCVAYGNAGTTSINYTWFQNNTIVSYNQNITLNSSVNHAGQNLTCQALPYDGSSYGTARNISVIIKKVNSTIAGSVYPNPTYNSPSDVLNFYANYTSFDNNAIPTALCNLSINGNNYIMSYSSGKYVYPISASSFSAGVYIYSIFCNDTDYYPNNFTDTAIVLYGSSGSGSSSSGGGGGGSGITQIINESKLFVIGDYVCDLGEELLDPPSADCKKLAITPIVQYELIIIVLTIIGIIYYQYGYKPNSRRKRSYEPSY
jgi:hypothetical protein